jgi:hypothetical protein
MLAITTFLFIAPIAAAIPIASAEVAISTSGESPSDPGLHLSGHAESVGSTERWNSSEAPLPQGAHSGQLWGLACATASACAAVGGNLNSTSGPDWLLTGAGKHWRAAVSPVPSDGATNADVAGVTCPAPKRCLAVGDYVDASGHQQGLLLNWNGHSWTATTAPLPVGAAASPAASLTDVECASSITCVAVGTYTDDSGEVEGMLLSGHDTTWSAITAPLPSDAARNQGSGLGFQVFSMTCPSADSCVLVGFYEDSKYLPSGFTETGYGTTWAVTSSDGILTSVSCPSSSTCVAVGAWSNSKILVEQGYGTAWKRALVPLPSRGTNQILPSISCATLSSCVAVGSYYTKSGGGEGLIVYRHGSSWKTVNAPHPADAARNKNSQGEQLDSISCLKTTANCIIAGQYTDSSGDGQIALLEGSRSSWKVVRAPLPANSKPISAESKGASHAPETAGMACQSAVHCLIVGSYNAKHDVLEGFLLAGTR